MDHDTATSNHPTFTFKNPCTFIFTFSREGGGGITSYLCNSRKNPTSKVPQKCKNDQWRPITNCFATFTKSTSS